VEGRATGNGNEEEIFFACATYLRPSIHSLSEAQFQPCNKAYTQWEAIQVVVLPSPWDDCRNGPRAAAW
jgi:hypothetical protein